MKQGFLYLLVLVISAAGALLAGDQLYYRTPAFEGERRVIIPKGTRSLDTARLLAEAGAIQHPELFWLIAQATQQAREFKAGEYQFETYTTPQQVMQKLVAGDVVIHKITLPEGYNVRQLRELLAAETVLQGEITLPIAEGSLLPETYFFTYGDTRNDVVRRMQSAMAEVLADHWNKRAENLPLASPQEALILASIVEKETGVVEERARVAGVFINRLRIGMRLQTDPSVIYGIEQETGQALDRELTRADLDKPTPFNSYLIPGLPPTPIANPGADSIAAVMNPLATDELYFVATGNGGHHFAKTLEEHNKNVASYRAVLRAQ